MKNEQVKILSPKLDVVFQALFGEVGSERITKNFLESILKRKIEKIDLSKNPILRREFKNDKLGVLDILAKINEGENCNIEMQILDKSDTIERILYYWSRLYSRQIKMGESYKSLEKTIVILIAYFKLEELKELEYHSSWKIVEENNRKTILTNKLEIHIIELPKIVGKEDKKDELLDWLYFLENPKSERVEKKMKENEGLKEANEKLNGLSEDEKMQRIAWWRQKAIMDEKAIYSKGVQEEKEEIARKMLEEKMDIILISKLTGLTKEEIEKLK